MILDAAYPPARLTDCLKVVQPKGGFSSMRLLFRLIFREPTRASCVDRTIWLMSPSLPVPPERPRRS